MAIDFAARTPHSFIRPSEARGQRILKTIKPVPVFVPLEEIYATMQCVVNKER